MSLFSAERPGERRLRLHLSPVTPGDTARRTLAAMVAQQVAPTLHEWGLEPDGDDALGTRFSMPSDVWHLRLALRPMAWGTVGVLRFDVPAIAVPREAWDQWRVAEPSLPELPDPCIYYAQEMSQAGGLQGRLGSLAGPGRPRRWAVHAREDPTPTAASLLTAIRRDVLPAFGGRAEAPPHPHGRSA